MKTLIKNGQVYMNRHFEKKDLLLDDRRIAVIGDFLEPEDADTAVYDAESCYVTPGFIDVHTHGGFGVDVNAATQEDYEKIGHFFAKEGTTSQIFRRRRKNMILDGYGRVDKTGTFQRDLVLKEGERR